MTQSEIDQYKNQLQSIVNKLNSIHIEMSDIEVGESELFPDDQPILNLDDSDIENWYDNLSTCQEEIESFMNSLSLHL